MFLLPNGIAGRLWVNLKTVTLNRNVNLSWPNQGEPNLRDYQSVVTL